MFDARYRDFLSDLQDLPQRAFFCVIVISGVNCPD